MRIQKLNDSAHFKPKEGNDTMATMIGSLFFLCFVVSQFWGPVEAFTARSSPQLTSRTALNAAGQVPMVPYYIDQQRRDYMWMDIYNALGRERTLFVSRYIDDEAANQLISSLLYLGGKSPSEPIRMYFNVPGAMAKPTLAIFDVLRSLSCPVETINMGLTVGLGCLLVAAGTPSKRLVTPNARFLVGRAGMDDGLHGQTAEILVQVKDVMKDNQRGIAALARLCKVDQDRMVKDTQRDFYLTAPEAVQYGLVDAVLIPPQPIKIMRNREADNDVINFGHFSEARQVRGGPASRGYTEPVKPKGGVLDVVCFSE
jgi:ATP-dependent Clp protease protease subunit